MSGRSPIAPAVGPRATASLRVLVVDAASGAIRVAPALDLASLFDPGDLLVVNDAATLPGSLFARTEAGAGVELRLVATTGDRSFTVALLGAGDWRTRTEDRPPPPSLVPGDRLRADGGLVARVAGASAASSRLVDVELSLVDRDDASAAEVWSALYRAGKPVQYAHVSGAFALWDVQNVYAGRPWAMEMPSAGRALRVETLLELRRRGVDVARVTHAAGLSSIGDAGVDVLLPLPERFEVPEETWERIARARQRGGRVVAIGTSVVRARSRGAPGREGGAA